MEEFEKNIGKKCRKSRGGVKEPKPFKSGSKINTIKGVTMNPHINKVAYSFEEDDSVVNCDQVIILS